MIREFLIIFMINYIGIIITNTFNLIIPGTIVGMIFLFILLYTKILKLKHIEGAGNILLANMTVLFLPPSVKLIDTMYLLKNSFFKILFLLIITTILTMVTTAKTVDFLIKREEKNGKNIK